MRAPSGSLTCREVIWLKETSRVTSLSQVSMREESSLIRLWLMFTRRRPSSKYTGSGTVCVCVCVCGGGGVGGCLQRGVSV